MRPFLRCWTRCAATLAIPLLTGPLMAQIDIDLGTGLAVNAPNQYPAPYGNQANGSRHQLLVLGSELAAAGMGEGDIVSLAFHVATASPTVLQDFTVRIGSTAATGMTNQWLAGTTVVWGPQDHTAQPGWNTHPFSTPFVWDGVSNVVVETCFSNGFTTENSSMYRSSTGFTSVTYRATPNPNVCTFNGGNLLTSDQRPDLRFGWVPLEAPPIAAFTFSPAFTCTGAVQFTDGSNFAPTAWEWHFGDDSTSTEQNPLHTYVVDGVFDVTLIVTNAFGSDTLTVPGAVTVNASGAVPQAICPPVNAPTIAGFGITSVTMNDVVLTSGDAVSDGGYLDRGCVIDTVAAGSTFTLTVVTGTIAGHQLKAWVDWDNSGSFDAGEVVLAVASGTGGSASLLVPSTAVQNVPLRVRVMTDYDLAPLIAPCTPPQFGQAEDLGLVVIANTAPPVAAFTASPVFTCDGAVQFSDATANLPTGWTWDFGDGNGSNLASPQHIYAASGTYTVQLIAINANGQDTLVLQDLVTVDLNGQLDPPQCTPQTQGYCCGFGLLGLTFAGITSTSPDGVEGYVDRTCGNVATVEEGTVVPIQFDTDDLLDQDVYVWIDLDDDGAFANSELVFFELSATDPSGAVAVPQGFVYNTPLRMRVAVDVVGELTGPCDAPSFGQVEDFSVIVVPVSVPPTALFTASPTSTCDGVVQFTDQSAGLPFSWQWTFGDGGTSTDQDPLHTYTAPGTYTVSLTVENVNGTNTLTLTDHITYVEGFLCDTTQVPDNGLLTVTECQGVLVDDGGVADDYSPGFSAPVTIAPPGAEVVTLTFTEFAFEENFDYLAVYDGPDVNAPLLHELTGNGLGALPNGGVISSTGPALCVRQEASNGPITWAGFVATWDCSFTGIGEAADPIGSVHPVPTDGPFTLTLARPAGAGWSVTINNALGELVAGSALPVGARVATFDAAPWTPGSYSLTVKGPDGRWTRRMMVHH
ncbi:MAG: PKD domain-containing protein [Flavobacteriales bacterium]|nr:PKD domain-containing protein [Flavobacteriales bacterium]